MKTKLANLIEGDFKIVEKKKTWFLVPAIVAVLTAIMLLVYTFAAICPLNLSIDMAGGYVVTVRFTDLSKDNYQDYKNKIDDVAKNLENSEGDKYGLKISDYRRIGEYDANSAILVSYHKIKGFSNEEMTQVGERFVDELGNLIIHIIPEVSLSGGEATLGYSKTMSAYRLNIENELKTKFPTITLDWLNATPDLYTNIEEGVQYYTQLKISGIESGVSAADIKEVASVPDEYSGKISDVEKTKGSTSTYILNYGLSAMLVMLVVMILYILLRFKSLSIGLSCALSVLLDLIMTFCFVAIFHVAITGAFVVALVTVMGLSLFTVMGIFDKIKENIRSRTQEESTATLVARSVKESFPRTCSRAIAVLIIAAVMAIVCAIAGAPIIVSFALPLIFGVVSSTFTSLFIAPSFWSVIAKRSKTKAKDKSKTKKEPTTI